MTIVLPTKEAIRAYVEGLDADDHDYALDDFGFYGDDSWPYAAAYWVGIASEEALFGDYDLTLWPIAESGGVGGFLLTIDTEDRIRLATLHQESRYMIDINANGRELIISLLETVTELASLELEKFHERTQ